MAESALSTPGARAGRPAAAVTLVGHRAVPWWLSLCLGLLFLVGCSRPYRVGDRVLVEWGSESQVYPAFIVAVRPNSRFRVHFEGYASRWDEEVTLERIRGLSQGPVAAPPPPRHVRLIQGMKEKEVEAAQVGRFQVGERVRVRFRGSEYRATVLSIEGVGRVKVHYDGHEDAWDEVVDVARITTGP